jgi:hypothetical protein
MDDIGRSSRPAVVARRKMKSAAMESVAQDIGWIMMMKGIKLEPRIELLEIMVVLWGEVKVGWERLKRLYSHTVRCDEAGDGQQARAALGIDAALDKRL